MYKQTQMYTYIISTYIISKVSENFHSIQEFVFYFQFEMYR